MSFASTLYAGLYQMHHIAEAIRFDGRSTRPEIVYHYTQTDVLLKAFTSLDTIETGFRCGLSRFWASDSRFLNDKTEFQFGYERAKEVLSLQPESDAKRILREALETQRGHDAFVVCFSALGDDLGQWRAYGDGGKGISLGIHLHEVYQNHSCGWVLYEEGEQVSFLSRVFEFLVSAINEDIRSGGQESYHKRDLIHMVLSAALLLVKHPGFADEREFRVSWTCPTSLSSKFMNDHVKYRTRNGRLVPYVELANRNEYGVVVPWHLCYVQAGPLYGPDEIGALARFLESHTRDVTLPLISTLPYA